MFTLGQAAKETGVAKTTIARAIKNGRLSASKNDKGEYSIDPSELFRVYKRNTGNKSHNTEMKQDTTPNDPATLQAAILEERVRGLEDKIQLLERQLEKAEGRADTVQLLLNDQRERQDRSFTSKLAALFKG